MLTDASIIIPSYNEAKNLPNIFEQINSLIKIYPNLHFIIVDNGSKDNTKEVFSKLAASDHPNIKMYHVPENRGYGYGIMQGLKAATTPILAWTHGDLQTDLADIVTGIKILANAKSPSIAKGNRKNRAPLDSFFTWGMQKIASILLRVKLEDINAQPKIFTDTFFQRHLLSQSPDDFSLDLFMLYQANINHYQVLTFPVYFHKRLHGQAKGGGSFKTKLKLIKRTLTYMWALHKKITSC